MAQLQYTAEVKAGLLLKLPKEAENLNLQPGDKVRIQVSPRYPESAETLRNENRISALGKYAFVPGGSEEFAGEKQTEIEREV